ncbi:MAG TPA: hypothetical protein VN580_13395 [Clostridia bacterium]|nr:hypothetical protein [Clostridia bacterium]
MELVNRYIYAVTKGLPQKQRGDIEKELKTLIEDMLEQHQENEPYEAKVEKILTELGDPAVLAENYRESKRYLIGPDNYDNYIMLLKIVLGAVFLGISVAIGVGGIFSEQQSAAGIFGDYIAALFSGLLQGFAWVTAVFAFAERRGINLTVYGGTKGEAWSIAKLPEIPEKEAVISPAESVFTILVTVLFITILYLSPQIFGVYVADNITGTMVIPIFDTAVIKGYRLMLAGILVFSIAKEVIKLVSGRWTLKAASVYSVLSIAATAISLAFFNDVRIWNPDFSAELLKYTDIGIGFINPHGRTHIGVLVIIAAAGLLDVATVMYKGIKYN